MQNGESREQILIRLIESSRAELQFTQIPERQLEATMRAWLRRLENVPDEYLERVFDKALTDHVSRTPITPIDLLKAWKAFLPEVNRSRRHESENCPYGCTQDGMIHVDRTGVLLDGNFDGEVFVRPCPTHRPEKWNTGNPDGIGEDEYLEECRKKRQRELTPFR